MTVGPSWILPAPGEDRKLVCRAARNACRAQAGLLERDRGSHSVFRRAGRSSLGLALQSNLARHRPVTRLVHRRAGSFPPLRCGCGGFGPGLEVRLGKSALAPGLSRLGFWSLGNGFLSLANGRSMPASAAFGGWRGTGLRRLRSCLFRLGRPGKCVVIRPSAGFCRCGCIIAGRGVSGLHRHPAAAGGHRASLPPVKGAFLVRNPAWPFPADE